MANHKSAKKRNRQNIKRRAHNRVIRSSVRTVMKQVRALVEQGELDKAKETARAAEKRIAQATAKGLYHASNGSRKISRMYALIDRAGSSA